VRGKVLTYSDHDGAGVISGDDGQRYGFTRNALQAGFKTVVAGADVDFQIAGAQAIDVYVTAYTPGLSDAKNRIAAALLAWFLGWLGIHKFYLGKNSAGLIMMLCGTVGWLLVLPGMAICLVALIEAIIYLTKSDQQFYQDYVAGDRAWF
jgi:TM2 domain-containing membrane protein YozV/cold shock CspA family protein